MRISIAWEIIGAILLALFFLFMFKGEELIVASAKDNISAYESCNRDPDCYMTYENYKDYNSAVELLEKYK